MDWFLYNGLRHETVIESKIANSAKTDIEVSFKKIHALTLRIYFKNYTVWRERIKLCF